MTRYHRTVTSQYLVVILIVFSIVGFAFLSSIVMSRVSFTDQFAIPWAAGRAWLLEGKSPYALTVADMAESIVTESEFLAVLPETRVLTLPLLSLLFYLPFSLIPYSISRVIWVVLLAISVGFIVYNSIQLSGWKLSSIGKLGVVLLFVFWLPSATAILTGQLSPMIIALTLLGLHLLLLGQETSAGFIFALTFSSFPDIGLILLFLFIWSISQKQWSVLSSFFSGVAFLILLSWLILPSWFMEWASVIFNLYFNWDWINTPLMNLASLLPGIADFLSIFLHAAFILFSLILLITTLGKSGRVFIYKISVILIIAYLLNMQNMITYLLFLGPATFTVFRYWSERWRLIGKILSWVMLLLIGFGSWLLVFPGIDFTANFIVPLLSIGYPLLTLLGLFWVRWWALRILDLPYKTL